MSNEVFVGAGVTQLMNVDWMGDGFKSGRGFGQALPSTLYVRTQAQVVAPAVVANEVYEWVEAGAHHFANMVTAGQETDDLAQFIGEAQIGAERAIGQAEHETEGGWQSWLETLGGKYSPTPADSYDWARFLHPRPFITEDRRGVQQAQPLNIIAVK